MSNGDSDSDQYDFGSSEFGTAVLNAAAALAQLQDRAENFTVNLRQIELTGEQRDAISSDIIAVITASIGKPNPPGIIVLFDPHTKVTPLIEESSQRYPKYM